jgi:hypothetical protein
MRLTSKPPRYAPTQGEATPTDGASAAQSLKRLDTFALLRVALRENFVSNADCACEWRVGEVGGALACKKTKKEKVVVARVFFLKARGFQSGALTHAIKCRTVTLV